MLISQPDAIYLHPDRKDEIYRIFKITDDQRHRLIQLLTSESMPPPDCPLPIIADKDNRQRVDPEEPIEVTGIYRDLWERKPPHEDDGDERLRDVLDTFNYVTREEWEEAGRRATKRKYA